MQFDPEEPVEKSGVEQLARDLEAEAEGRPVPIRPSQLRFSRGEVQGLTALFGRRPEAAQASVEQLRANVRVSLPERVTRKVLERYAKIAEFAIARGIDKIETQNGVWKRFVSY